MKKLLALLAVLVATTGIASAQFGIIAGLTSSTAAIDTKDIVSNVKNVNQYHVGIAYQADLPLGFGIQPQLMYQVKGANLNDVVQPGESGATNLNLQTKTGFIELGLGVQWGIDLMVLRPFALVQPFVGYRLSENRISTAEGDAGKQIEAIANDVKDRLEYGFAIGAGLELLDFLQLSVKWYKNLGNVAGSNIADNVSQNWSFNTNTYQGWQVTLGVFFGK